MPNLSVIRERVRDYVQDLPTETDALVDDWINKGVRDAQDDHNLLFMEKTVEFVTVEGQRSLGNKPDDWKGQRALPWLHAGDGDSKEIEWAPSESEMIRRYAEDDVNDKGEPAFILGKPDDTFEVFPLPDNQSLWNDGDHRVKLPYWGYLDALTLDADSNWFTNNAEWYLTFQAAGHGLVFNRDPDNGKIMFQLAQGELARAMRQQKRSRLTSRSNLSISFNARGS